MGLGCKVYFRVQGLGFRVKFPVQGGGVVGSEGLGCQRGLHVSCRCVWPGLKTLDLTKSWCGGTEISIKPKPQLNTQSLTLSPRL